MISKTFKIFALLLITIPMVSIADVSPFRATYELTKFEFKLGVVEVSLIKEKNNFIYEKKTIPSGFLKMIVNDDNAFEKSVFSVDNKRITSKEYLYELTRRGKLKKEKYLFEKPTRVKIEYKNDKKELDIPAGTLDRSSMEIALMMQAHERKDQIFNVIDKGKLKKYTFSYKGKKTIDINAEVFECDEYKVLRSSGDRSTTLCLAEALDYMPIFAEHDEKGTTIQIQLIKLENLKK